MHEKKENKRDLLANERRKKILELLQEDGSARVKVLSGVFQVTEPTIRQDLEKLEQEGHIIREHGGAYLKTISQQVSSLSLQHLENLDKKSKIAAKALSFINDGDSLILDSGSTVTELAKLLSGRNGLTVITNALNIALLLGANPSCQLLVTGGEFKPPTLSLTGEQAAAFFNNAYVDKLFLAAGGISSNMELTYPSFNDLPVKRAMIRSAQETFLLADSSKFGNASFASLGSISQVNYIITDKELSKSMQDQVSSLGVTVIIA
ncbi:MAG: DeoR/GlpR transcriptional regulator [Spirochaetes bacterium]|nr:DeoR/GlpR transcriptional regulator [Spirochaetota bacterium]MBL7005713.1 DeoR/GlpR transcriptional regulator [Spirochaetia bacterium]